MRLPAAPFRLPTAVLAACSAPTLAAFAADQRPVAPAPEPVPDEQQIRDVAKTLLRAHAAEDHHRMCAQFAPGTFSEG
jgi:hypothetical protein